MISIDALPGAALLVAAVVVVLWARALP